MVDMDMRLWRVLRGVWLVLAVGVLGLLLGLMPRPTRGDSIYGLLIVALVALPVGATYWRMPAPAKQALRQLPRRRRMLTATGATLCIVTALVLCWTIVNLLAPGSLAPLALALVGVGVAGVLLVVRGRH